ncbi:hypothetical protein [Mesobacillus boroniphilus]|uniref:Sugar ABC transporter n=2 Tax=Mesobacillus boroniphilus TaxID=308892 RepID=W4RHV1_9BACI|nr:hypothetical protein [Mesobacillus boroniphilus]GAE43732.1 sugar ABC transporter [Mesobacillus boroniphilus JCM 21738]
MNAMTEIPPELANTIIAIIIYFAATSVMIERLLNKFKARKSNKEDKSGPVVEKGDS